MPPRDAGRRSLLLSTIVTVVSGALMLAGGGARAGFGPVRSVPMVGPSPSESPGPTASPSTTESPAPTPRLREFKVRRPDETDLSITGSKHAWTYSPRNKPRKARVLLKRAIKPRVRVSRKGFIAHSGALHGDKLVYQERRRVGSYNSQIRLYDTRRRFHPRLPAGVNTRHFEWAPVVHRRWLAFTRFERLSNPNPRSTLRLVNLKTGRKQILESRRGADTEIRSGQMAGRYLTWQRCTPECEVLRYDRRSSTRRWIPKPRTSDVHNYAPSVTKDGSVYFAQSGNRCGNGVEIYRFTTDGGNEKVFDMPDGMDLQGSWATPLPNDSVRLWLDVVRCETGRYDIYSVDIASG